MGKEVNASNTLEDPSMNNNGGNDEVEIDLGEIFYLLWTHIVQIIGLFIAGAVVVFLLTFFLVTPKYTATARMYITSGSNSVVDLSSLQVSSQLKADYQELIKSNTILQDVVDNLSLDEDVDTLKGQVTVTNPSDTRILNLSVTTTNAQLSADIANELAKQAKTYLPKVMKSDEPNVFEEAQVPDHKSSPSYQKNALIGGLLAALLYCAVIIIKHVTNDTFVTPDDINKVFGVQPLAAIPEGRKPGQKRRRKKVD
ncbi:Wzz/FepE/Etk N-terminal domain-containing protein [Stecheria sp. CLA-KB-P133]|uniref:Wzz/FepE/Etk N-terminal domain-containing protein n=1 Tax=Grylomicrobium aquisgranensis TaxID=2926318 RepID=A0AB35U3J7_9FIRM|nr:Wzz/FepE/Etk N-terminal domain-containing protein [Stecheria sp. CLA-KB-P133]